MLCSVFYSRVYRQANRQTRIGANRLWGGGGWKRKGFSSVNYIQLHFKHCLTNRSSIHTGTLDGVAGVQVYLNLGEFIGGNVQLLGQLDHNVVVHVLYVGRTAIKSHRQVHFNEDVSIWERM